MDALLLLTSANFDRLDTGIQRSVYREFYQLVYPGIVYKVNDHAAAEDIIQEAFLKVVNHIPAVENETKLKNWIKVVARNTAYNYLRKNKKDRNLLDVDSVFMDGDSAYSTDTETVEAQVEMNLVREAIEAYLKELKPDYRILIQMRWLRELSYREIAEELEIREDTVKYKLHRARDMIKKRFLRDWGDKGE